MFKLVKGFGELGIKKQGVVDCYTSCEALEAESILEDLGYHSIEPDSEELTDDGFLDSYFGHGYTGQLKHNIYGLIINCVEIPLDEDLRQRKAIGESGFPAQTKLRIHNKTNRIEKVLTEVAKRLLDNQQNVAFVNPDKNTAYVKHARYY